MVYSKSTIVMHHACDPKVQFKTSLTNQQSGILNENTKSRTTIRDTPVKWTNINAEEPPRRGRLLVSVCYSDAGPQCANGMYACGNAGMVQGDVRVQRRRVLRGAGFWKCEIGIGIAGAIRQRCMNPRATGWEDGGDGILLDMLVISIIVAPPRS